MSEEHNQAIGGAQDSASDADFGDAPFGNAEVASMEDILASIRSMIAEDEIDASPVSRAPTPVEGADIKMPDIETASRADMSQPRPAPQADVEPLAAPSADLPFNLDSLLDPIHPLEDVSELSGDAVTEPVSLKPGVQPGDPVLDIERLFEPPAPSGDMPEPSLVNDPLATKAMDIGETEDMDLVKSLMADLTEAPDMAPDSQDVAVEALDIDLPLVLISDTAMPVALDDVTRPSAAEITEPEPHASSVLDEILDQSLADETALNAAVELPEFDMDKVVAEDESSHLSAPISAIASGSALAAIAAQADAHAAELSDDGDVAVVDPKPEHLAVPILHPVPTADDPVSADLYQALEEEVMARNAPLEEIVADEVEEETGSAFAELNRLVEEKQEFQDRGPRIGDLVQEALKPMLKEWLDENLKTIVERAVQKEVKRIATGK